MTTTCQICERTIQANNAKGVIAHHGYQRPDRGSGWQTSSCWGARHLPYEKSCDQLQPCIDHIKRYIANQKAMVKDLMQNPPAQMTEMRYSWIPTEKRKVYDCPADFDAKANLERGSWHGGYEYEHASSVRLHQREVETSTRDIKRLEKRLADWKLVVE